MPYKPLQYKFIAIEGNIGAGKTTLCKQLANFLDFKPIFEAYDDNPLLENFYKSPEHNALTLETHFLIKRYQQIKNATTKLVDQPGLIADYHIIKSLIFGEINLKKEEKDVFKRLFEDVYSLIPQPDIMLLIERPVKQLKQNIKNRGRAYEHDISGNYLQKVNEGYYKTIEKWHINCPVLKINAEFLNFLINPNIIKQIADILEKKWKNKALSINL